MRAVVAARASLLAAVLCCEPAIAAAQTETTVLLEHAGSCPDRDAVAREIAARIRIARAPGPNVWVARIEPVLGGARLTLLDPHGRSHVARVLVDEQCESIARAIAYILHRQFVALELPISPDPGATAASAAEVVETPAPPPRATLQPDPAAPALRPSMMLEAGGGIRSNGSVLALGLFRVGLSWPMGPLLRVTGDVSSRQEQQRGAERIELTRWGGGVEAGWELLGEGYAVASHVGAGLSRVTVSVPSVPDTKPTRRWVVQLVGGATLLVRLGGTLWATLAANARFTPRIERYVIAPAGEIGHFPRVEVDLALGLMARFEL